MPCPDPPARDAASSAGESKYRFLIEASPDAIFIADAETCVIIDCNEVAANLIGKTKEEIIGFHITTLHPPQDAEFYAGDFKKLTERPSGVRENAFVLHKKGHTIPVDIKSIGMEMEARKVRLGIFKDVSERVAAEKAVRESEALLRSITDNTGTVIFLKDLAGRYLHVNLLWEKLFHTSSEAVRGKTDYELFPKEMAEAFIRNDTIAAQTGQTLEIEERVPLDDGIHTYISVKFPVRNISGEIYAICGIATDITQRKAAEEELHRFFNLVPDMMCVASVNGYFLKVNPVWEQVLGYTERELLATPFLDFIHPDDRDATMKEVARQIAGESTIEFLNRYRCKDGGYRWLEWMATPSPDKRQLFAAARDVTDRKAAEERDRHAILEGKKELEVQVVLKAEERRKAQAEADNATQLKNNFISLVAHDLKSPLASLSMGLEALAGVKDLSPENREFAVKMANHSREIHKMTERLLDLSLLQAGMIILQKQVINCRNFAAMQIELYEALAAGKGITILNYLPEKMTVLADPDLFGQCVKNVLSNALKFCSRGDTIAFINPQDMSSTIAVKDTGPGIAQEKMAPILTKEMKMRTVGTAGEKGTGIGLIHTKEIMEAHGGTVTFESEAGKGSIFYLNLPAFDNVVLVVDDDESALLVMRLHLKHMGTDVLTASNGFEALKIVQDRPPILIITDIKMPVMDGFELLHRLKTSLKHSQIPVIVITAINEMDARKKAFADKAADFINKPLVESDFIPRVGRFVAGWPLNK